MWTFTCDQQSKLSKSRESQAVPFVQKKIPDRVKRISSVAYYLELTVVFHFRNGSFDFSASRTVPAVKFSLKSGTLTTLLELYALNLNLTISYAIRL